MLAGSSRSQRSVDSIIATSAAQPERPVSAELRPLQFYSLTASSLKHRIGKAHSKSVCMPNYTKLFTLTKSGGIFRFAAIVII
jgi:hypothetical protein